MGSPFKFGQSVSSIRVYRDAALSISNSLMHLAFDAISPFTPANGMSLSGGNIVPESDGGMRLTVFAATDGVLLTAIGLRMVITRDPAGAADIVFDQSYRTTAGEPSFAFGDVVVAVVGDVPIKVELELLGAASDDLIVGDGKTFATALMISR